MTLTDVTRTKMLTSAEVNLQTDLALTTNPIKRSWIRFTYWLDKPANPHDLFFVNLRETYQSFRKHFKR